MYTIKQASLRSGVGISLIRAWERRYGVVEPARTPGGYRLYDDDAIGRLRTMRGLVDTGWSAGQAAAAVMASGAAGEAAQPSPLGARPEPPVLDTAGRAFLEAAGRYDVAGVEKALDEILTRGSFEAIVDDLLLPAVAALGTAWEGGQIDVAAEHLASAAVMRRLAALLGVAGAAGTGPTVLVGLPPEGRHEIGAQAFAVALRRLGIDVIYVGADVPTRSWASAARESRAAAIVIGVVATGDVGEAANVVGALRTARPGAIIAVGGPRAHEVVTQDAVTVLPGRVVAAARAIARAISEQP